MTVLLHSVIALVVGSGMASSSAQTDYRNTLCREIVTQLFPEGKPRTSIGDLPRLEVRRCDEGILQVVGWSPKESVPHLIRDTNRTSITSLVTAGNVAVLETAGASSNVVQVIVFEAGKFTVAFEDAFKSYATITTSWKEVKITCFRSSQDTVERTFPTGRN